MTRISSTSSKLDILLYSNAIHVFPRDRQDILEKSESFFFFFEVLIRSAVKLQENPEMAVVEPLLLDIIA